MPVATISDLTVRYGPQTAVDALSVEVPEGCVGLLGPNAAGKTTLIKALLGFVRPVSGNATVLGLDAASQSMHVRRRVGLLPETDCHIPGLNAVSFVAYAGELSGMPASAALRRAHEVLEYCGLGEERYRNVETYSTGMKQRIKLAQALVHGPKLVFLDEPTNGLDPAGREELLALVRDVSHGKGVNVVVSSHLLLDVERTCDHIILMQAGRVATQGPLEALRATDRVQVEVELQFASDPFLDALRERGAELLRQMGTRYQLAMPADTRDVGAELFAAARATGAQVRGFRRARRSLEDIFVQAVQ